MSLRAPRRASVPPPIPGVSGAPLAVTKPSLEAVPRGSRAAIVTTVKDFAAQADSWVNYHLAVGFVHLYVYFDDAAELTQVDLSSRFPASSVTCVPHDAALRKAWGSLPKVDSRMRQLAVNEVQTRQQLNALHAMGLAVARGLDWLLHIDADELFSPGPSADAVAHFGMLSRAGVATFCYMNHEAVPEAHGIVDPFRHVTLFKRSLEVVQRTAEAQAAVGFWQTRQAGSFFYYYDNGKAAVRVAPAARPLSVHEWLPGSAEGMRHWYSNMRDPWAGRGELGGVVKYMQSEACILHYPCYNVGALHVRWKRGNANCARCPARDMCARDPAASPCHRPHAHHGCIGR